MTQLPPGASPVDAITAGSRLREWEIVAQRGRGSYGVVFEARRSSWLDEPHRALKVFDPIISAAARHGLVGEFSALTGVRHPHLLAGIDAFDLDQPPYAGCVVFVIELADEDLTHRQARAGTVPAGEVAAIGAQVADGLAALHSLGRIHGDVKPENVLRVGDRWVVGDFGVTSVLEGSYALAAGTTIDYRPPEMATASEGQRLHRSADVWAMGVTLHVAATGRHPFPGPDPMMRYAAVVRGDRLPNPPGLDPALAHVIDNMCLVRDPRGRAPAADLAAHLRALAPPGSVPDLGQLPTTPSGSPVTPSSMPSPVAGYAASRDPQSPLLSPSGGVAPATAATPDRLTPLAITAAVTAVVAAVVGLAAGALPWSLAANRTAYTAVSLGLLAVAGGVAYSRAAPPQRRALPWALAAATVTWLAATALLFGLVT